MNRSLKLGLITAILTSVFANPLLANDNDYPHLPPIEKWSGKSEKLLDRDKKDLTPAERTDLSATPSFRETIAHIHKLSARSPHVRLKSIGKSTQDHPIFMVVASKEGEREASGLIANKRPTILLQAGIHSGEIDGKDAGLMLLRDIAQGREMGLIQKANILFIPIFSADGHNRVSEYNRVNQRGPEYMGWRTISNNLNLNRDYAKAETVEIQALLKVIAEYQPDLYVDLHVTDGEDYQYDITYGYNASSASLSPNIAKWFENVLRPKVDKDLENWGHTPGPLIFSVDKLDFKKGIVGWTASPRYSNGYGDARHLPTILVENHSLKPYRRRVLGTYVLIKSMIELLHQEHHSLRKAVQNDKSSRPKQLTIDWQYAKKPELVDFKGIDYELYQSQITGRQEIRWLGTHKTYQDLPRYWKNVPKTVVDVPRAYIIPVQYQQVIASLEAHGVEMIDAPIAKSRKAHAYQQLKVTEHQFAAEPFEGRQTVKASFEALTTEVAIPPGSKIVSTNQPLGKLVVSLLDPRGPDSYFAWGYFNSIFQRTEYIESYAVIPLAENMLAEDPKLKKEFETKLKNDKAFADDPKARLDFFYQRTPYYDQTYLKYPILMEN